MQCFSFGQLLGVILLTSLPTAAWAQSSATEKILTLDAALAVAEANTQTQKHHAAQATAARNMAVAATQLPDPVLQLALENLVVDGPNRWHLNGEPMTMSSVGLMQTFTRENKRTARADRYEQEARLADTQAVLQLAELRRNTALAWLQRYYWEQQLSLLQQQRTEAELLVTTTTAAYRAGRNLQTDVFMAHSALALMDDRLQETNAQLTNAITALTRWVGTSASAPLGAPPTLNTISLTTDSLEQALTQQPELLVMAQAEVLATSDVRLAQENKHEDWTVELMLSRRDSMFGNMLSVGVSIPLQWRQSRKQDRELAATLAMVDGVRSERIEMLRTYLAQTQRWLTDWHSNLARLTRYDTTLVPLAADRSQAALTAYANNTTALTSVLDARRNEIDIRLERLRLEMATAELWAQLEFLLPPADTGVHTLHTNPNRAEN
jgi:outer membrane protein, heavy metal efflux system